MGKEILSSGRGHTRFDDSDEDEPKGGSLREGGWVEDRKAGPAFPVLVGTFVGAAGAGSEEGEDGGDEEGAEGGMEVVGWLDLTAAPFDLYGKLSMPRDSRDPRSKSRTCYHRLTARWHPRGFPSRPIVCDGCGCRLSVGPGWLHKKGSQNYDVCKACHEEGGGEGVGAVGGEGETTQGDKEVGSEAFVVVDSLEVLGGDRIQYERELQMAKEREDAIVQFKMVPCPLPRPAAGYAVAASSPCPSFRPSPFPPHPGIDCCETGGAHLGSHGVHALTHAGQGGRCRVGWAQVQRCDEPRIEVQGGAEM